MRKTRGADGGTDTDREDAGRPANALTCRLRCGALLGKGKVAPAREAARRAVELEPDDWRNHHALLLAILATPSLDVDLLAEARRVGKQAVALGRTEVPVHLASALLAARGNDRDGAEAAIDEALRIDHRNALAYQTRDRIQDRRNAADAAVAMYRATLDTAPADPRSAATALAGEFEATLWGRLQAGYLLLFGCLAFAFLAGLSSNDQFRTYAGLAGTTCFVGGLAMVWRVGRRLRGLASGRSGRTLWILLLILLPGLRIAIAILVLTHNPVPAAIVVAVGAAGLAAAFALAPPGTRIVT
ncbi:MAG: hypothetical protein ACJ73S_04495 [Mycobacteriales bacterium]